MTSQWTSSGSNQARSHADDYEYLEDPLRPANGVRWSDLTELLSALNDRTGHHRYALPTEAQWEYAALAGSSGLWSFGYDEVNLDDYAWNYSNTMGIGLGSPQGLKSITAETVALVEQHLPSIDVAPLRKLLRPTSEPELE